MALAVDPPPALASAHGSGSGLAMVVTGNRPSNPPPPPPRRMRPSNARGAGEVLALERVDVVAVQPSTAVNYLR